jgi:subtilisin family serine protease
MIRRISVVMLLFLSFVCRPASAQLLSGLLGGSTSTSTSTSASAGGVVVRTTLGLSGLQLVCLLNGCTVVENLDGNLNQVFLVKPNSGLLPDVLAAVLRLVTGILDAEVDQVLAIPTELTSQVVLTALPSGLWYITPVNYFGTPVWQGYASQPAAQIIRVSQAQSSFHVSGAGIVADIDTGVDPNHPALKPVLLQGYDFTRNQPGGSEITDLGGATGSGCSTCQPAYVNQHTAAMVDQHTAAMVDGTAYAAFGHGTMVMGVIHLVAPTAKLLPLKAFHADGTGNLSDIIHAIYYAVQNKANVINMSFDLKANSTELTNALNYATNHNVVGVASAGNDGLEEIVYPAALQKNAVGVASTNDFDQRSTFSNYGNQVVWVAAPGEDIISTYPFGTYSVSSGTSFSAPFVSGTASLLLALKSAINQSTAESAVSHAKWIGPNMGYGRLDVYNTLSAIP